MKAAIRHLTKSDPILARIIERVGPFLCIRREPTFETLARSIAFQQLSGKAAKTIFDRVRKATGRRFTPSAFLKLTPEQLRACGLSRQKIAALTDLAERTFRKEIDFRKLHLLTDEEVILKLSQVRGVGIWTSQMFLIFALERPNVMPIGDLGIRNAIRKAYGLDEVPKPSELVQISEKWRPYCSIASWYLWRSLDGPAALP
ncbi:MAG TPA: DNA-3-methyladenine glycosylase [Bryobacteraceae bacterium]|jgi:DNA-3-methyladenine glycosylase II|nr:DNA-3-methyladenine glycosylase [Bryobacteraceae bacterium]